MTREEFGQAYESELTKTIGALKYCGASTDKARDVAQEAWLTAWRRQAS